MLQNLLLLFVAIGAMLAAIFTARIIIGRRQVQDSRRGLFLYSDGKRLRAIDPITAIIALEADPEFRFDKHPKRTAEGDQEAAAILARAVRDVFKVPAFTSPGKPGLTVAECYRLLQAFALYVEGQKKNTSPFATTVQSMESTPPGSSEPITSDTSPSGSSAGVLE